MTKVVAQKRYYLGRNGHPHFPQLRYAGLPEDLDCPACLFRETGVCAEPQRPERRCIYDQYLRTQSQGVYSQPD